MVAPAAIKLNGGGDAANAAVAPKYVFMIACPIARALPAAVSLPTKSATEPNASAIIDNLTACCALSNCILAAAVSFSYAVIASADAFCASNSSLPN